MDFFLIGYSDCSLRLTNS